MGHCPDFAGTTRTLRLPVHPSRLDFVSFVMDGTTAASELRSLRPPDARRRTRMLLHATIRYAAIASAVEMAGSPKFPLEPSAAMHMLLRLRTNRPTLTF